VASHEHILLPFNTPQPHALPSADSKATQAANNKERLGVRHDIVCPKLVSSSRGSLRKTMSKKATIILQGLVLILASVQSTRHLVKYFVLEVYIEIEVSEPNCLFEV